MQPVVKSCCIPHYLKSYTILQKKIENCTRGSRDISFPGFQAFIDSTEQEIQRPKNKKRKKEYYSGKKKKHTV